MDFNNNNFFNLNMKPYFTLTSFDSDNSDPTMYDMNQPYMSGWNYPTQYDSYPQSYDYNFKIISTLHRVHGDSTPPSLIFNHLLYNFHIIHSLVLLHILLFLFHQLRKKSNLERSMEAML